MAWLWPILKGVGEIVLQGATEGLTRSVAGWVSEGLQWVTKSLTKMLRSQTGILGFLGDKVADFVEYTSQAIEDNVTKAMNTINEMAQKQLGVWKATERNLASMTEWIGSQFQKVTTWINDRLADPLGKIGEQLGFTQDTVKAIGERKTGLSERGLTKFGDYMIYYAGGSVDKAEEESGNVLGWLASKGGALKDRVVGGYNNAVGWLKEKATGAIDTVASTVSGISLGLLNSVEFLLEGFYQIFAVDPETAMQQADRIFENLFGFGFKPPGAEPGPGVMELE